MPNQGKGVGLSQPQHRRGLALFRFAGRYSCPCGREYWHRVTGLAHLPAQLSFDARCLQRSDWHTAEADASCSGEHNHAVWERLYDGEEEGTRCRCADGITRKNCCKSGEYEHFRLAWGCVGILKGI